ncbi:hypothetical protein ERJ75_001097500 [Trypanosoma vivax]|nr:hypothetical protein ERJ75_001097500 [Trypanosoma vivax]
MKTRRASAGEQLGDEASELDMGTREKEAWVGKSGGKGRKQSTRRHEDTGQREAMRCGLGLEDKRKKEGERAVSEAQRQNEAGTEGRNGPDETRNCTCRQGSARPEDT